jgi:acetate kinase
MRVLLGSSEARAKLAVDYFVYKANREIGSLATALGGLDGLIFTAGIGENSQRIAEQAAWLGIDFDSAANSANANCLSHANSHVDVANQ